MSSLPTLPSSTDLKSFWSRPEGKTGALVLLAAAGLGIWFWGSVVGFLVIMLADTLHLVELGAMLAAFLYVIFSKRTQMMFRLAMRALTGIVITLDPIGILKDKLLQMKKKQQVVQTQIRNLAGQKQKLIDTIKSNNDFVTNGISKASEAKRRALEAKDPAYAERMKLQLQLNVNKAGRRAKANIGYQELLTKISGIYDFLVKFDANIDFFIQDTSDEVEQAETTDSVIGSAYKAFTTAWSIMKGNATEEDMYNGAKQYLADEASRKLGAIDDITRVAQGFIDNMDVENGAIGADALKAFDAYQQKILTSGDKDTQFLLPGATPVPVSTNSQADEYVSFLK
jgi:hypothetical protein